MASRGGWKRIKARRFCFPSFLQWRRLLKNPEPYYCNAASAMTCISGDNMLMHTADSPTGSFSTFHCAWHVCTWCTWHRSFPGRIVEARLRLSAELSKWPEESYPPPPSCQRPHGTRAPTIFQSRLVWPWCLPSTKPWAVNCSTAEGRHV
jgi:hypothetical protein